MVIILVFLFSYYLLLSFQALFHNDDLRSDQPQPPSYGRIKKKEEGKKPFIPFKRKPEWVKQKVLRLKALCPMLGCRKIAALFNRLYQYTKGETVGKTYVSDLTRDNLDEIQVISKNIKHAVPKQVAHNLFWSIDLTTKTDSNGKRITILGIEEHRSRVSLVLMPLKNKSSLTILTILMGCAFIYGRPKIIKTDNEAVFTSKLFRSGLFIMRIKHWNGTDVFKNGYQQAEWFEAWDGLLTGYYLRV